MIPYCRQDIAAEDIEAVVAVLRSDWLTQGPAVPRFEEALAARCGARQAVAVSSGTAALSTVLGALDLHDLAIDLKKSYYQELNIIIDALGRPWLEEAGGIVVPRPVFDKVVGVSLGAACRTYNILASEQRVVVAALLP